MGFASLNPSYVLDARMAVRGGLPPYGQAE
jgi:hypothetical protein